MATLIPGADPTQEAFELKAGHIDLLARLVGRDELGRRGLL
ncbi:hypothetical protein [Sphingomonas sp. TDK1]|nr:hypothetical protein [Sphingomonas sp. TDK1]